MTPYYESGGKCECGCGYSSATSSPASIAGRLADGSTPTTSNPTAHIRRCVSILRTGELSASRAIAKPRRSDGVATGSNVAANEIAAERLSQEVLAL